MRDYTHGQSNILYVKGESQRDQEQGGGAGLSKESRTDEEQGGGAGLSKESRTDEE